MMQKTIKPVVLEPAKIISAPSVRHPDRMSNQGDLAKLL
jgi:hypothetical protein